MPGVSFMGVPFPKPGRYNTDSRCVGMDQGNIGVTVTGEGKNAQVEAACMACGRKDYVAFYEMGVWFAMPASNVISA